MDLRDTSLPRYEIVRDRKVNRAGYTLTMDILKNVSRVH